MPWELLCTHPPERLKSGILARLLLYSWGVVFQLINQAKHLWDKFNLDSGIELHEETRSMGLQLTAY